MMDIQKALIIFDALSQETRLKAFRLLIKAGLKGLTAGDIGKELNIAHNTLSFHLSHLCKHGVISSKKEGRCMIYSAKLEIIHELVAFIVSDCCSTEFASIHDDDSEGCSIIKLTKLYPALDKGED